MSNILQFNNRREFREWLTQNYDSGGGFWLRFGKKGGPKTIKAGEALEEALCFGWIDGQMNNISETEYLKYFRKRLYKSKWSEKNKALVEQLRTKGLMTEHGERAVKEAKQNGMWDQPKPEPIKPEQVERLKELLKPHEPAFTNFESMSPSVQRTYTLSYFDAKTEDGRKRRLERIISRCNQGLKPM